MYKIKHLGFVAGILLLGIFNGIFRDATNVPVTLLDIIFFPIFVFIILYVIRYMMLSSKRKKKHLSLETMSTQIKFSFLLAYIGMLTLGTWAVWEGILNPGTFFSGVKGAVHGDKMIPMGLCVAGFAVFGIWQAIKAIYINKR